MTNVKMLALTVDTEVQALRSSSQHPLEHLIWGEHDGQNIGISKMMDIADCHDVRMTFYVDYPEYDIYGDAILDVSREITRRGHNAELHIHPEFLAKDFGSSRGLGSITKFTNMGRVEADAVADYVFNLHYEASGIPPTSFRGGGYRYTKHILDALSGKGISTASNDNATKGVGLLDSESRCPFKWDNGLIEIPITTLANFRNLKHLMVWNFNKEVFSNSRYTTDQCVQNHLDFLEHLSLTQRDAVPILVMHSWSFWDMGDDMKRTIPRLDSVERFDQLLSRLKTKYEILGMDELGQRLLKKSEKFTKIKLPES
jgi:hypothetical protein